MINWFTCQQRSRTQVCTFNKVKALVGTFSWYCEGGPLTALLATGLGSEMRLSDLARTTASTCPASWNNTATSPHRDVMCDTVML